ncbi:MAG: GntP family permease [Fusobacterium sp.]|uniref:GntP family permease n=1 Tax=Fusobacterium sp. TaxID=68766 RepID=UPI0026DCF777|nr:GntP family permease [Fusobacterium sp.]MDO4690712.1 GntP family permease [Fusobacterium sp.]
MVIGVIGIILSLILLMYLAYRGVSVLILAPILACFAAFMGGIATGEIHLLATYTEVFMKSLGGYVMNYFPLFLLGAIFGKVMDDTGAAKSIANVICKKLGKKRAIPAIVIACAILTYGGVSLFVVAFAVYPIAAELFREVGIPKRFIPGAIALGAFTFTMTALPGTPQIQNAIPMQFFGTDVYAAPIIGLIASAIMLFGGLSWLQFRAGRAMAKGEGYGNHKNESIVKFDTDSLPNFGVSLLPIIVVLGLSFVMSKYVFPSMDLSYLENYKTTAKKVVGNWSLITSLVISIILAFTLNYKKMENPMETLTKGVSGSFLAVMNTASEVGYGNVIAGLAAFAAIKGALLGLSANPLVSEAISVSSLAGITGSASGGLSIALGALGETYLKQAQELGINPEVLHRIAVIACGGLDTLPHNGAVITLLGVTGLTHKESYIDIGMCTAVIPTIAVIVCIILASFGIV